MTTRRHVLNLRRRIWIRDQGLCVLCGQALVSIAEMTLDHVVPKSKGGRTTYENLQSAHKRCNELRGNGDPPEAQTEARRTKRDAHTAKHAAAFARNHRDPMTVTILDRFEAVIDPWDDDFGLTADNTLIRMGKKS